MFFQKIDLLYNCGKIFFLYYHFFVGYILSFGLVRLRTIRLSARVEAHIERRCSRSHGEDVTITDIIIKTPDRKWDWGSEWRHARERWAEDLRWFLKKKKQLVEIWGWTKRVDFWASARPGQLGVRDAPRVVGSDGTVSILKIVSLSPSVEKTKSQEGNKSFVPEQRKSSVFRVFRDSYAYERSTYLYILRNHISVSGIYYRF